MNTTRTLLYRVATIAAVILVSATAHAEDNRAVETTEVKRADVKGAKHESLRFLRDNRVFIRAQLDLLSVRTITNLTGEARIMDERYLQLQQMVADIRAAQDTVKSENELMAERELLTSITDLGELEAQLVLLEDVLAGQRERLLALEADFLGHQETGLVILIRGMANKNAPSELTITEQNTVVRVSLNPEQRASLERGGIAMVYHEYVEPREHIFEVTLAGAAWKNAMPVAVPVDAARDQLTFLELDLSNLNTGRDTSGLVANVWYR